MDRVESHPFPFDDDTLYMPWLLRIANQLTVEFCKARSADQLGTLRWCLTLLPESDQAILRERYVGPELKLAQVFLDRVR
jgi:hypothetical protein